MTHESPTAQSGPSEVITADDRKWLELIRKELFWALDMATRNPAVANKNARIEAFDKVVRMAESVKLPPAGARDAVTWPARFGCNGPEGSFWTDDSELANKLIAATYDRDEWTVTDTTNPTGISSKLVVDTQPAAPGAGDAKDWPEDFAHENGNYENVCHQCERHFHGHKRRITCKECATTTETNTAAPGMGGYDRELIHDMLGKYADLLETPGTDQAGHYHASSIDEQMQLLEAADHHEAHTRAALAAQPAPVVGGLVVGEAGWIDPTTRTDESLVDCALQVYSRSIRYGTKGQHDAAMACRAEILRRLAARPGGDDTERCESGDPECGPVEFHDVEGVPLCRGCWEQLAIDSAADHPAQAGGGRS